jgi:acyl-CoA thioesterase-1
MAITPANARTRRNFLVLGAGALISAGSAAAAGGAPPVVTVLGDSITAGFGLSATAALPARLQLALNSLGVRALVRGAGVSGDTSADGLARVGFSVQGDTALCVVALGGNDLLQGLDPKVTRTNLAQLIAKLKRRRIAVLLVGLTAPKVIGAHYAAEFNSVFPDVARAQGVALYPDLLAGVSGHAALIQADGLHPNAAGADLIAKRLAPVVARTLKAARAR